MHVVCNHAIIGCQQKKSWPGIPGYEAPKFLWLSVVEALPALELHRRESQQKQP
jgi:hypothetical protein